MRNVPHFALSTSHKTQTETPALPLPLGHRLLVQASRLFLVFPLGDVRHLALPLWLGLLLEVGLQHAPQVLNARCTLANVFDVFLETGLRCCHELHALLLADHSNHNKKNKEECQRMCGSPHTHTRRTRTHISLLSCFGRPTPQQHRLRTLWSGTRARTHARTYSCWQTTTTTTTTQESPYTAHTTHTHAHIPVCRPQQQHWSYPAHATTHTHTHARTRPPIHAHRTNQHTHTHIPAGHHHHHHTHTHTFL